MLIMNIFNDHLEFQCNAGIGSIKYSKLVIIIMSPSNIYPYGNAVCFLMRL